MFAYLLNISLGVIFISYVYSIFHCNQIDYSLQKKFYRIKPCYRLNKSIIAKSKLTSFSRCLRYAIEKKGLGFNFSPVKKQKNEEEDYYFMNCEVLGCPDVDNLTNLLNDSRFDYYSLYGNTEEIINSFCIQSVGIFHLHLDPTNYSTAQNSCKTHDGRLAHIVNEIRTYNLGKFLADRRLNWKESKNILEWNTVAYIGLNDQKQEGYFVTEKGEPLECFKYRAWAPGHPRKNRKKDDCVIIDDDKTWRAVNCAKKLPYFCEIQPMPIFWNEYKEFLNNSCTGFTNRTLKRRCKKIKKKFKKAQKDVNYKREFKDEDRCDYV